MSATPVASPIRPLGVGEVVLRVANLHQSIEFYRDVLGLLLVRRIQADR